MTTRIRTGAAVLLALALSASACSTKAKDSTTSTGTGGAGEVKTGPGVDAKSISLGVLTDESGVFAALGKRLTGRRPQRALDPVPDGPTATSAPDSPAPARTPIAQEDTA